MKKWIIHYSTLTSFLEGWKNYKWNSGTIEVLGKPPMYCNNQDFYPTSVEYKTEEKIVWFQLGFFVVLLVVLFIFLNFIYSLYDW